MSHNHQAITAQRLYGEIGRQQGETHPDSHPVTSFLSKYGVNFREPFYENIPQAEQLVTISPEGYFEINPFHTHVPHALRRFCMVANQVLPSAWSESYLVPSENDLFAPEADHGLMHYMESFGSGVGLEGLASLISPIPTDQSPINEEQVKEHTEIQFYLASLIRDIMLSSDPSVQDIHKIQAAKLAFYIFIPLMRIYEVPGIIGELEDLAFKILDPRNYEEAQNVWVKHIGPLLDREQLLRVSSDISACIEAALKMKYRDNPRLFKGIPLPRAYPRIKSMYTMLKKKKQGREFIHDPYALTVCIPDEFFWRVFGIDSVMEDHAMTVPKERLERIMNSERGDEILGSMIRTLEQIREEQLGIEVDEDIPLEEFIDYIEKLRREIFLDYTKQYSPQMGLILKHTMSEAQALYKRKRRRQRYGREEIPRGEVRRGIQIIAERDTFGEPASYNPYYKIVDYKTAVDGLPFEIRLTTYILYWMNQQNHPAYKLMAEKPYRAPQSPLKTINRIPPDWYNAIGTLAQEQLAITTGGVDGYHSMSLLRCPWEEDVQELKRFLGTILPHSLVLRTHRGDNHGFIHIPSGYYNPKINPDFMTLAILRAFAQDINPHVAGYIGGYIVIRGDEQFRVTPRDGNNVRFQRRSDNKWVQISDFRLEAFDSVTALVKPADDDSFVPLLTAGEMMNTLLCEEDLSEIRRRYDIDRPELQLWRILLLELNHDLKSIPLRDRRASGRGSITPREQRLLNFHRAVQSDITYALEISDLLNLHKRDNGHIATAVERPTLGQLIAEYSYQGSKTEDALTLVNIRDWVPRADTNANYPLLREVPDILKEEVLAMLRFYYENIDSWLMKRKRQLDAQAAEAFTRVRNLVSSSPSRVLFRLEHVRRLGLDIDQFTIPEQTLINFLNQNAPGTTTPTYLYTVFADPQDPFQNGVEVDRWAELCISVHALAQLNISGAPELFEQLQDFTLRHLIAKVRFPTSDSSKIRLYDVTLQDKGTIVSRLTRDHRYSSVANRLLRYCANRRQDANILSASESVTSNAHWKLTSQKTMMPDISGDPNYYDIFGITWLMGIEKVVSEMEMWHKVIEKHSGFVDSEFRSDLHRCRELYDLLFEDNIKRKALPAKGFPQVKEIIILSRKLRLRVLLYNIKRYKEHLSSRLNKDTQTRKFDEFSLLEQDIVELISDLRSLLRMPEHVLAEMEFVTSVKLQ